MVDEKTSPQTNGEGKEEKQPDTDQSSSGTSGQSVKDTEAPLEKLPKRFQDKSPKEIAKAYVELEKKMGQQSKTVAEAKKFQEQADTMLRVIWSDPDLYRQVEEGIRGYVSGEKVPERNIPSRGDEEAKGKQGEQPKKADDLRRAEENRILREFRQGYGYDNLPEDKRQDKFNQTAVTLAELLDPSGKKPVKEIVNDIPLDKLPKYLSYAHQLAHRNEQKMDDSGRISEEENRSASIGSFPSSSGSKKRGVELTAREREIAQKMGVSEKAFAKRKEQIQKEREEYQ